MSINLQIIAGSTGREDANSAQLKQLSLLNALCSQGLGSFVKPLFAIMAPQLGSHKLCTVLNNAVLARKQRRAVPYFRQESNRCIPW
ncbi:MAG: hypothetical protein HQ498_14970 [Pseudohongiella sp.]|nr:hypothetical protein [Pseudohongiella sp.]